MRRLHGSALLMVLALVGITHRLQAGDLPPEFVSQYAPAVERLRQFYTHTTIHGQLKREFPVAGKSIEQNFVFRAAGVQLRMDLTTAGGNGVSNRPGSSELYLATRDGSLVSTRRPGDQVFDDARELKYGDTKLHIRDTCLLEYPYTFSDHPTLLSFLQQSNVIAVKVTRLKRNEEILYRIRYTEVAGREDRPETWQSWFLLSPAEGWAIREYSRATGQGDAQVTYRGSLEYELQADGMPLVVHIESSKEFGSPGVCQERTNVVVNTIKNGDPSIQYFTAFDFSPSN
jgi:hypothetical protein